MKIGLIGLPKSGKTTLFNLLTGSTVATARYDAGRAELHTGVARVPDPRVDRLSALFKPKKTTYASFEVVDLAGIAKGERGGLETKEFRNADALLNSRSEEHTSELQSRLHLVCRLLLEKKKKMYQHIECIEITD